MPDRKTVIYTALKSNPYATLPTLSAAIKRSSGAGVAVSQLARLREALAAGAFDSVYDQLFAENRATPRRKSSRASRHLKGHVSAPIHQGFAAPWTAQPVEPASSRSQGLARRETSESRAQRFVGDASDFSIKPARKARKVRGDRRGNLEPRGRRDADLNKIQLREFSEHLVVFRKGGAMQQATFKSRERAEKLVRELLSAGLAATDIAYYRLNPIKANMTATV